MCKRIVVITGASGSGKTTVGNLLTDEGVKRLVTSTTRPMREGEVAGVDYHFLKQEDLAAHEFVEQTLYNGNHYGLTVNEIESALAMHDYVCVVMDKNGAMALKRAYPELTTVIYLAVSKSEMVDRMRKRGDSEEAVQERIVHAEKTGEFVSFMCADLTLEGLTPEDNTLWILSAVGMTEGKTQERQYAR